VYVRFTSGPCSSSQAFVSIKVFDETILTIPNAFTPNNDGINDAFRIQVMGYFKLNHLQLFNRYGQMVHEVRDLALPWDGSRNGTPLPVGTYYWVIEGIDMHNKLLRRTGSVTIIR
jgi:gliding motility-associated-like protein